MKRLISEKAVNAANRLSAAYDNPRRRGYLAFVAAMLVLPFTLLLLGLHPAIAPLLSAAVFAGTTIYIAATGAHQGNLHLTHDEATGLRRLWVAPLLVQLSLAVAALFFAAQMARREVALVVGLVNVWSFTISIAFAYALNLKLKGAG